MTILNALPVVKCRNEEYWIEAVLTPLVNVFGIALVADTGSTDSTLEILRRWRSLGRIHLFEYGIITMKELGQVRADLGKEARRLGAEYIFLCDADELYNEFALFHISRESMAQGKTLGYTAGVSIEEVAGTYYEVAQPLGLCGRTAVIRADDVWKGDYPFESPSDNGRPERFYYFTIPQGFRYHHLHLHRLVRSSRDADVQYRVQKRFQFCMQDLGPITLGPVIDMDQWRQPCQPIEKSRLLK
jgi:glycosyltransferase involved in cell wall biosynthesis